MSGVGCPVSEHLSGGASSTEPQHPQRANDFHGQTLLPSAPRRGLKLVINSHLTKRTTMTCRYAHKRVALLFTVVQAAPTIRVIDWPQKEVAFDHRFRQGNAVGKSQWEKAHANK
jgi:hypothetical protein